MRRCSLILILCAGLVYLTFYISLGNNYHKGSYPPTVRHGTCVLYKDPEQMLGQMV